MSAKVDNNHKAHKPHGNKSHKKPNKPKVVHHHHYTTNVNTTVNGAPQTPPTYPGLDLPPIQPPQLTTNQDLFAGFTTFLGGLLGGAIGGASPQPFSFDYPALPSYPAQGNAWPTAPAYPSNGTAGGWSAWGAARGYSAY